MFLIRSPLKTLGKIAGNLAAQSIYAKDLYGSLSGIFSL